MLDGTAISEMRALAQDALAGEGKLVVIEGVTYSTVELHDVRKKEPQPAAVVLATLSGLAGFIKHNVDGVELPKSIVHVVGPELVQFESDLYGDFDQRDVYAEARCPNRFASATAFSFGKWMTPESLIIAIQCLFDGVFDRPTVLALLGNVRDEFVKTDTDDGVSQSVSAKAGITLLQERKVPNPVILAPFRTFDEVEQPATPFVLRLRKDESDGIIRAALFEADGGAWRTAAIRNVAAKLAELLADQVAIVS